MEKKRILLTRLEIEQRLEKGLVGKTCTFEQITAKTVTGRIHRLAVEDQNNELIVIFLLDQTRYEADLGYFKDHLTIQDGDINARSSQRIGRLIKGD